MHQTQRALLELSKTKDLDGLTLQAIANEIGVKGKQTVVHHLQQLNKQGKLKTKHGRIKCPHVWQESNRICVRGIPESMRNVYICPNCGEIAVVKYIKEKIKLFAE